VACVIVLCAAAAADEPKGARMDLRGEVIVFVATEDATLAGAYAKERLDEAQRLRACLEEARKPLEKLGFKVIDATRTVTPLEFRHGRDPRVHIDPNAFTGTIVFTRGRRPVVRSGVETTEELLGRVEGYRRSRRR
jgi:hypothetical protein